VISAFGLEAWLALLMAATLTGKVAGDRMAIISGPGGLGVGAAEACGKAGLRLAQLSETSRERLSRFLPPTGTSLQNPIDVGMSASLEIEIYNRAIEVVSEDPEVDALMIIGVGLSDDTNRSMIDSVIATKSKSKKPFFMIRVPHVAYDMSQDFCQVGIPFFESAERALGSYARLLQYSDWSAQNP